MTGLAQTPDLLVVLAGWVVLAVWATWAVRTRPRMPERWKADYEAMLVAFRVRANEWEVEK